MDKDREQLSDEELKEKMEFDRFVREYKPLPFYLKWKFYGTLALAGVLGLGFWFLSNDETEITPLSHKTSEKIVVRPPLDGVDIADTTYELSTGTDTILYYATGSSLTIPAHAFLDRHGKPVNGDIQLHYRELHDASDFFISGIPVTYDSNGVQYHFESAGMIEISASLNGECLFANPEERISVQLASAVKDRGFHIYYLDTVERKWTYVEEDKLSTYGTEGEMPGGAYQLKAPVKANSALPRFDVAFDKKQFPELMSYDGMSFQVEADEKYYDPKLAMKEWENVTVQRTSDGIHYLVTFSNPGETHTFRVEPVYAGPDYTRAISLYEKKRKTSAELLPDSRKKKPVPGTNVDGAIAHKTRKGFLPKPSEGIVYRQFTLNHFGIWNSGCPHLAPHGKLILARFVDERNKKLDFDRVYLLEFGNRTLFSFYPDRQEKFSYNPDARNLIWGVTRDNKLAIFRNQEFDKIKKDKDSSYFKMDIGEQKMRTPLEVKKMLGIE